jgi:polyhydroxyalkanoate synthesis regulator phasin
MDDVVNAINHCSVLMKDQNSKLDAVLEGINSLPTRADFHRLEQRLDALERDVKVIKATVTATNRDLATHKSLPTHVARGHA